MVASRTHGRLPSTEPARPNRQWQACPQLRQMRPWRMPTPPTNRCVLVAPHPDDEILGAGGTAAAARRIGHRHRAGRRHRRRKQPPWPTGRVASAPARWSRPPRRPASAYLRVRTVRLGHPDGQIAERRLTAELTGLFRTRRSGPGSLAPRRTPRPRPCGPSRNRRRPTDAKPSCSGISCGPGIGRTPTRISRGATRCESTSGRSWPGANAARCAASPPRSQAPTPILPPAVHRAAHAAVRSPHRAMSLGQALFRRSLPAGPRPVGIPNPLV